MSKAVETSREARRLARKSEAQKELAKNGEAMDKRRLPRVTILAHVANMPGEARLEVENASAVGFLLRGADGDEPVLLAGNDIELSLDAEARDDKPVRLKARVVRVSYGDCTRFGLEITKITEDARRRYYELLAFAHIRATSRKK